MDLAVARLAAQADDLLALLAQADSQGLTTAELAECVLALEKAQARLTAARAAMLAAFDAQRCYELDGQGSTRTWLAWQARTTRPAAAAAVRLARLLAAHRDVRAALAAGTISVSWARQLCEWSELLPDQRRQDADVILLGAAAGGLDLPGLAGLAEEMRRRTAEPDQDTDNFDDRWLRLDKHWRGGTKLDGELTPSATAALEAVLDALGKKAGPEDVRTKAQRRHDALEEACRRLLGTKCLPDRAGQPTQIQLHMTLDELRLGTSWERRAGPTSSNTSHPADGKAESRCMSQEPSASPAGGNADDGWQPVPAMADAVRRWQAVLARTRLAPMPAGLPIAGPGYDCDAAIVPVVTGNIDPAILDRLAHAAATRPAQPPGRPASTTTTRPAQPRRRPVGTTVTRPAQPRRRPAGTPATGPAQPCPPGSATAQRDQRPAATASGRPSARGAGLLRDTLLRYAVDMLSGPAGLAAWLRTSKLTGPASAVSLPLDIGAATDTVPPHLRRALALRDGGCRFPGCDQPPMACHPHHLIPRAAGGPTNLDNLLSLCSFHHLIAVHRWNWSVALHGDGTVTATSPDGSRVLHSHRPPATAA